MHVAHRICRIGLVALLALACDRAERPNLLLVTLDTTRADRLGPYGFDGANTPNLDDFARNALVYDRAVSTSSWTLPSHASIFTGLLPMQHGAQTAPEGGAKTLGYSVRPLGDSLVTLAERLTQAGYRTSAVVAGPALSRDLGVAQGFAHYDDALDGPGERLHGRRANLVADRAIEQVEAFGDEPWFLFVNFFDPHAPYEPPPPHDAGRPAPDSGPLTLAMAGRLGAVDPTAPEPWEAEALAHLLAGYDAEIAYMDLHLGRLLRAVEADTGGPGTWIAITADHGESFGEHGYLSHGAHLYDDNLHVPLLVHAPGRPAARVPSPVSTRALFAEVLVAAGIEPPATAPRLTHPPEWILSEVGPSDANVRLFGRWFDRRLHALEVPPYKLIQSSRDTPELYDLAQDPKEARDLAAIEPELVGQLQQRLAEVHETHAPLFDEAARADLSEETREALRELGYLE